MPIKTSPTHPANANITLVGGAAFEVADLHAAIDHAPHIIAADSGADRAMAAGVIPRTVIGDMDSRTMLLPDSVEILAIEEQDSTDFEKCLRLADAPLTIAVGFLGGRLDHSLAAFHALLAHAERRIILIGETDIAFAAPLEWRATLEIGTRISFFPLHPCSALTSSGLRWPIDGLDLAVGSRIGTSNITNASDVSATFGTAGCVTILPKHSLNRVVASFNTV